MVCVLQGMNDPQLKGIIPRMVIHREPCSVFKLTHHFCCLGQNDLRECDERWCKHRVHVKVSYIEIYMERIRDLLDCKASLVLWFDRLLTTVWKATKTNLQVREEKTKGIWIEDATEIYVTSERDVIDVMKSGSSNRAIAATSKLFIDYRRCAFHDTDYNRNEPREFSESQHICC